MKLLATISDTLDPGFCRIVAVDLERETAEVVLEWLPPPGLRTSGKGFTGLAWLGGSRQIRSINLRACRPVPRRSTQTWTVTGVLHQPCMNDLHHVAVHEGQGSLVTNTGLDRVDAFDMSGRFIGGWELSPAFITAGRIGGHNPSRKSWAKALQRGWNARQQCAR